MILKNQSLQSSNTFGIDATTKYYTRVTNIDQLKEVMVSSQFKNNTQLILGGGSNILLTKNFDGITVKVDLLGKEVVKEDNDYYYVKVGAGENWHQFVQFCLANNYNGVENLSLIPGSVGAAPMQNIGAYGIELKNVVHEVEAYLLDNNTKAVFDNATCEFGYRSSIFKTTLRGKVFITAVTFKLPKTPVYNTTYGAIEQELEKMGVSDLSISVISKAVCNIRSSKLPNPDEIGNAGSFFKNPVVEVDLYEKIKENYPNIVGYPVSETTVKLAAGWLIETAGWKGKTFGNYGVHKRQALVLVNYGGATGKEIYDLSTQILTDVKDKFGVELEREVNIIS